MNGDFAAWLQGRLADRGIVGVADAARAVGVSQSMMSNYLNGKQAPSRKSVRKIAAWAGVSEADVHALVPTEERLAGSAVGVIVTPAATVTLTDPRAVGYFFGFLGRFERMTEEEKDSLLADEVDIPEPPRARGEGDVAGGAVGAGDPGEGRG